MLISSNQRKKKKKKASPNDKLVALHRIHSFNLLSSEISFPPFFLNILIKLIKGMLRKSFTKNQTEITRKEKMAYPFIYYNAFPDDLRTSIFRGFLASLERSISLGQLALQLLHSLEQTAQNHFFITTSVFHI